MATLIRFARPSRQLFSYLRRVKTNIAPACQISTSKKKDEVLSPTADEPLIPEKSEELRRLEEHFADADPGKLKNWITFGYSERDRELDEWAHHFIVFVYVSLVSFGIAFRMYHFPDAKMREWSWREAHLRIEQAELEGRPVIDPNFIPIDQIKLPSEEEIGDDDIIL